MAQEDLDLLQVPSELGWIATRFAQLVRMVAQHLSKLVGQLPDEPQLA